MKLLNKKEIDDIEVKEYSSAFNRVMKSIYKQEAEENGFKIAFGIAIIILGVLSIFYECANVILIGVSISSLLFTFIDTLFERKSILYFIPLTVLLIFCVFSKEVTNMPILKVLLDKQLNNFIVFASFGLFFLFNSVISLRKREKNTLELIISNTRFMENSNYQLKNSNIILEKLNNLTEVVRDKEIHDIDLLEAIKEFREYAEEEAFISDIRFDLSSKGAKDGREKFSIEEIEAAIIRNSDFNRNSD